MRKAENDTDTGIKCGTVMDKMHSPPQRLCSLFSFYEFDLRVVAG